jgi:ribosome-associated protein
MNTEILLNELIFKAVRSGGPGGQHANKVSSKVVLTFDLSNSKAFSESKKELLLKNLESKLSKERVLILNCDESRSQHQNKEIVTKRFFAILKKGLEIPKERKATKLSVRSRKIRLEKKKKQAFKKAFRKKIKIDKNQD